MKNKYNKYRIIKVQAGTGEDEFFIPGNDTQYFQTGFTQDAFGNNVANPYDVMNSSYDQAEKAEQFTTTNPMRPKGNNQEKFKPDYVKMFNTAATGVTGIANMIQNNKLKKEEALKMLQFRTRYGENANASGSNIPIYTKYGGGNKQTGGSFFGDNPKSFYGDPRNFFGGDPKSFYGDPRNFFGGDPKSFYGYTNKYAKKIGVGVMGSVVGKGATSVLMDSKIPSGKKQTGGNVEAEAGEMIEGQNGMIGKIPDNEKLHEEGGVDVSGVSRVLEDTSDKRKDKASKLLRISPEEMEKLFGFKPKSSVSHSKAFELATKHYDKMKKKIETEQKLINEKPHMDNLAAKTAELNFKTKQSLPTKEDIYDPLFIHQEEIKKMNNIQDDGTIAKYGGEYSGKAQAGYFNKGYGTNRKPKGNAYAMPVYNPEDGLWYLRPTQAMGAGVSLGDAGARTSVSNPSLGGVGARGNIQGTAKSTGTVTNQQGVENLSTNPTLDLSSFIISPQQEAMNARIAFDKQYPDITNKGTNEVSGTNSPSTDVTVDPNFTKQPDNKFYEPTYWDDLAPSLMGLAGSLKRDSELFNPVNVNQVNYKLLDPTSFLNANQADYNAAAHVIENMGSHTGSGVAGSELVNLQGQKYDANAKVLGNIENQNSQIKNREDEYNANANDRQSANDALTRETFDKKVKMSKEAQRQQMLKSIEDLSRVVSLKRRQNVSGNMRLKLTPAYDQNGNYNGYKYDVVNPNATEAPQKKTVTTSKGLKYIIEIDNNGKVVSQQQI